MLSMSRALSLASASNGLMRRCLLRRCAVKARSRNVVTPWGIQVPHEPLELSVVDHSTT